MAVLRFTSMLIVLFVLRLDAYAVKSLTIDIPKTQPLIVEIPPVHWAQKEISWGGGVPISVVRVDAGFATTRSWEDGSLPMLAEFHLEKAHDCGGTGLSAHIVGCPPHWSEIELRSDRAWLKLQIAPEASNLTSVLKSIVFLGTKEQFIQSSYLHDTVFVPHQKRLFSAVSALAEEHRFKLFQAGLRVGSDVSGEAFKDHQYVHVSVPLFTTFNTIRTSSDQRMAQVIREAILPQAKQFGAELQGTSVDGLAFAAVIPAYNFVTGGENKTDLLTIYMPLSDLRSFMDSDITSQRLLDSSIVLLNGDRVEAKL